MLKVVMILVAMSLLSSCYYKWKKWPNMPLVEFPVELANADPDFRQGWLDGCEVGASAGSNTFYKTIFRSNQIDGYKMTQSTAYKSAWNPAFWFCYRYSYVKNKSSTWNSFLGGYK